MSDANRYYPNDQHTSFMFSKTCTDFIDILLSIMKLTLLEKILHKKHIRMEIHRLLSMGLINHLYGVMHQSHADDIQSWNLVAQSINELGGSKTKEIQGTLQLLVHNFYQHHYKTAMLSM